MKKFKIEKSESEWKAQLGEEAYYVLRQKGTERAFTGEFNAHYEKGIYTCRACDTKLFESSHKFDSGCGWPSFDTSVEGNVIYKRDQSHGMIRTEIMCANCGGHLGHVFEDGPNETKQRYCVNSLSINFKEKEL